MEKMKWTVPVERPRVFSVRQLSKKIEDIAEERLSVDDFEEWFLSESWGHYDVGANEISRAIAAVHHVLHRYDSGEIEESKIAGELARVGSFGSFY